MGLFGLFKKKKPDSVHYPLTWFELQVAPSAYRFAILPKQPILIGFKGENGDKGATLLLSYDDVPEVYEKTVEKVDAIVQNSGLLSLVLKNPELAFSDDTMKQQSLHIRIAYGDDNRWASVYILDDLPVELNSLLSETKLLARKMLKEQTNDKIDGNTALKYIDPENNTAQDKSTKIVVKVRVRNSGIINVDNREVSISELESILDDLKEKNGAVWYYRDSPNEEPTERASKTMESVIDTITNRKLPIRLQGEEY